MDGSCVVIWWTVLFNFFIQVKRCIALSSRINGNEATGRQGVKFWGGGDTFTVLDIKMQSRGYFRRFRSRVYVC